MRTASRPSMSGSPTSIMIRSICPPLAACTPLVPVSTEMASNSSCSDNCSTNASRSSASSSTIKILRAVVIKSLEGLYWMPHFRQIEQSTRKAQATSQRYGDDDISILSTSYASDNARKCEHPHKARQPQAGMVVGRALADQSGAWPLGDQGQQAGRGWGNSGRV